MCVCQFHFHLSSHTSSPHQEKLDKKKIAPFTQKPSYYLIYHLKKGTLAVLWNSNGKIIWWHIPWYLHATPRYFKGMLKQWNLSCKCLNSSFYCVWPDSIQPALMFLKGARIRWVWCWAVCVVIINLFPGWNSIKCYYNNSFILWVRHFHISTAWLCFIKRSRKNWIPTEYRSLKETL